MGDTYDQTEVGLDEAFLSGEIAAAGASREFREFFRGEYFMFLDVGEVGIECVPVSAFGIIESFH
jgi:hypothetical protein